MNSYEVRVEIGSPVILEGNRIKLDEVLMVGNSEVALSCTNGLYHASQGMFDLKGNGLISISDNINPHRLPRSGSKKINIDANSGVWQVYKRKVMYTLTDEMVFYFQGDCDYVRNKLLDIGFLGSYTSLGFGEILGLDIKKIDKDSSFVKDAKLMRTIPIGASLDIELGDLPLDSGSYFEALNDCYCNNSLIPCYTPIQL